MINSNNEHLKKAKKIYADEIVSHVHGHKTAVMDTLEEIFGKENLIEKEIKCWDDLQHCGLTEHVKIDLCNPDRPHTIHDINNAHNVRQPLAYIKILQLAPYYGHLVDDMDWDKAEEKHSIVFDTEKHEFKVRPVIKGDNTLNILTFYNKNYAEKFLNNNIKLLEEFYNVAYSINPQPIED